MKILGHYVPCGIMLSQLFTDLEERRDRVQIFSDIIKVSRKPTKVTKILRVANVQYNTFQEYIDRLISAGLLEKIPAKNVKSISDSDARIKYFYRSTELGEKWCKKVEAIYGIF